MSTYKVSYKLLKQQIEEMGKVATEVNSLTERVTSASQRLGDDELLARARTNLTQISSKMQESATILKVASTVLAEVIEQYDGTETKNVSQSEGTKAYSRDFYKNPVTISDIGGVAAASYGTGFSQGYSAGADTGYAAGNEAGYSEGSTAGYSAGSEAGFAAGVAAEQANDLSTGAKVGIGAGVAAAGAAVGIGATLAGKKISEKSKAKKEAASAPNNNASNAVKHQNQQSISDAESALKKAQEKLDSLE